MGKELRRNVAIIQASYLPDATLEEVAESMCDLAAQNDCYVSFTYGGIEMMVYFHHTPEFVITEWKRRKAIADNMEVATDMLIYGEMQPVVVRRTNRGYPGVDKL